MLVERELSDELGEVAGIERTRQRLDVGHHLAVGPREPGGGERRLDLARGPADRRRRRSPPRCGAASNALRSALPGAERAGGNDDQRVAAPPVRQRDAHRRGARRRRASSTSTARGPGKKPVARVASTSAAGSRRSSAPAMPGQPHLRRRRPGPISASTSAARFSATRIGVGAVEQHRRRPPGRDGRGSGPPRAPASFTSTPRRAAPAAARCGRRGRPPAAARRRPRRRRLAKAEAVSRLGRAVAGDRAHLAGSPPAGRRRAAPAGSSAVPITSNRVVTFCWVSATPVRVELQRRPPAGASARRRGPSRSVSRSRSMKPGSPSSIATSTRPAMRVAGRAGAVERREAAGGERQRRRAPRAAGGAALRPPH